MPATKSKVLEIREIAFAALLAQGADRLTVQDRLAISRTEYYRLLARYRRANPPMARSR